MKSSDVKASNWNFQLFNVQLLHLYGNEKNLFIAI